MIDTPTVAPSSQLVVRMEPAIHMTDDEFYLFCQINGDLRIERTAKGEIVIMSPAGGGSSNRNANLTIEIGLWARQDGTGVVFDSSGGFILPNGAIRSPDVAWVRQERLAQLTAAEKRKFLPLAPNFAVELMSASDRLQDAQAKMVEYMANGVELGWLIDPERRQVFVYQETAVPLHLLAPATLAGEPLLPGLVVEMSRIWQMDF